VAAKNIDTFIERIEQIPTLPIVSNQIMTLFSDEDVSLKKVAGLIEKDQALAVKILKIANSAFYGTLSKVSTLDHALIILGIGEVKGILLAFSIHNFFSESTDEGFDRTRFWKHSVICSQVAKYLVRHFNVQKDDTLFLSGLIHDMGKVVFDTYFHEEFLEITDYVSSNHENFSKAEKDVLGITHYQVAAELLKRWKFPDRVIMNVFYHHAPWHDKNYVTGSIIIYLANIFTKLAGYPCLPSEKKTEISQFANPKVLDFIAQSGFDLDHNAIEKIVHQIREYVSAEGQDVFSFLER
jgi:putative nucleotidyltransferase with HDIG domain